jgi:hypothetical protein
VRREEEVGDESVKKNSRRKKHTPKKVGELALEGVWLLTVSVWMGTTPKRVRRSGFQPEARRRGGFFWVWRSFGLVKKVG